MNKTVIIVVAVAAVLALFLFMGRKASPAVLTSQVPPKGIPPQSNLISQVGSFLSTSQGQALEGAVADKLTNFLDGE